MSNYLKKILFSILILATPYINSASNAMNQADVNRAEARITARQMRDNLQDINETLAKNQKDRAERANTMAANYKAQEEAFKKERARIEAQDKFSYNNKKK